MKNLTIGIVTFAMILLNGVSNVYSQDLINKIPKDAICVGVINAESFNEKLNRDSVSSMQIISLVNNMLKGMLPRDIMEVVKESSPSLLNSYGVKTEPKIYAYAEATDSLYVYTLLFNISNQSKFERSIKSLFNIPLKQDFNFLSDKKTYYNPKVKANFMWDNEMAVIQFYQISKKRKNEIENIIISEYDSFQDEAEDEAVEEEAVESEVEVEEYEEIELVEPLDTKIEIGEDETVVEVASEESAYDWNDSYFELDWERRQMVKKACDSIIGLWSSEIIVNSFKDKTDNSILKTKNFKKSIKKADDFTLWFDYEKAFSTLLSDFEDLGMYNEITMSYYTNMLKGTSLSLGFNFNENDIALDATMFYGKESYKKTKKLVNKGLKTDFSKYIKDKDLIAYYALGVNIDECLSYAKLEVKDLFSSVSTSNNLAFLQMDFGAIANDYLELLDWIIDEDAISNVFDGEVMFLFSGMKYVDVPVVTYDFDEDFNRTKTVKTVTKNIPELSVLVPINDKVTVNRFFNLLYNTKLITKDTNCYVIDIPKSGFSFYASVQDDMMFITNNKELVSLNEGSGYPKEEQLSGNPKKYLSESPYLMYLNSGDLLKQIPSMLNMNDEKLTEFLLNISNTFPELYVMAKKGKRKYVEAKMSISVNGKYDNSAMNFIDGVDTIYKKADKKVLKMFR